MSFIRIDSNPVNPIPTRIVTPPPKTGTKITYAASGKVTESTYLDDSDIPNLPISKIIDLQDTLDSLSSGALPVGILNDMLLNNGTSWAAVPASTISTVLGLGSAALEDVSYFLLSTSTTADVPDSLNKRYVSDANLVTLSNTSGTNTGDQDLSGYSLTSHTHTLAGDVTGNISSNVIANLAVTNAKVATGIDAAKISSGVVSNTEFDYLNNVTSNIQTQINTANSNAIAYAIALG